MLQIAAYSFGLWLGLYLIARNPAQPLLRLAGAGLVSYALSLGLSPLGNLAPSPSLAQSLIRLQWALSFLPALFWSGALFWLLPENEPFRARLTRAWRFGLAPATAFFSALTLTGDGVLGFAADGPRAGWGYLLFAAIAIVSLLTGLLLVVRSSGVIRPKKSTGLILASTLFFTLGLGLLAIPIDGLPRDWTMLLVGVDLVALGVAIALLDAFDAGETLLPDAARSFAASFLLVALFGGQVALAIALGEGLTLSLLALLLATIAAAIAVQVFSDAIQAALDRLMFARFPRLRQARSDLRAATSALPRVSETLDPNTLDDAEFARLTRRAISHLGDLPHLAASPLTRLSVVQDRLAARGAHDDALERAAELKAMLTESIRRLKPRDRGEFGVSDEWRYYNALYFPYVVGLKPYSRRAEADGLDPLARQALDWLRSSVPERTLHNWQNAAARLVAQELRQKSDANERG